jgi:hypothetical protein
MSTSIIINMFLGISLLCLIQVNKEESIFNKKRENLCFIINVQLNKNLDFILSSITFYVSREINFRNSKNLSYFLIR